MVGKVLITNPECRNCPNQILSIDSLMMTGNSGVVSLETAIKCEHENICSRFFKKTNDSESIHDSLGILGR